jgi:hypothetical protein
MVAAGGEHLCPLPPPTHQATLANLSLSLSLSVDVCGGGCGCQVHGWDVYCDALVY